MVTVGTDRSGGGAATGRMGAVGAGGAVGNSVAAGAGTKTCNGVLVGSSVAQLQLAVSSQVAGRER